VHKSTAVATLAWIFCLGQSAVQPADRVTNSAAPNYRKLVDQYCVGCHNQRVTSGGLRLDSADLSKVSAGAETWEKVIRKLRAGAMPPPGMPRPDPAAYSGFASWLESRIDTAAQANPYAGRPLLHRMNRAEYSNAIRDLLGLEVDAASLLPPDDSAYGFDNVSDVLGVSPSLQERYLSAAATISALAVGDTHVHAGTTTYRIRQDLSQNQHIEGLPLGTTGGILVRHNFPLDGEYIFQAKLYRTNLNITRGLEFPSQVEFTVSGRRVHLASLGGTDDLASLFEKPTETGDAVDARLRARVAVKAGPNDVTAAFLEDPKVVGPARLQPFQRSSADNFDWSGWPHIQTFSITGPLNPTGPGDTPSRRKIFVCHPHVAGGEGAAAETACAREILSSLARRAYRQPVGEADLQRVLGFYESGRYANHGEGGFDAGIELALRRILASPKFVFRAEADPLNAAPGSVHSISDLELASRLAFFLWSSIPDDELLRLASQGKLKNAVVLDAQVRRMLADPKSQALVTNFAGQWLHLRNVRNVLPNSDQFPDFDENLRNALLRETELFFTSILREDRSALDLINADYTFLNERLARHYGISGIYGSQFRRAHISDESRRGLLGQGSILAVTSHAERTSPVVRGKWILENIFGLPVPPPPPNVPLLPDAKPGEQPRTMREQMEAHRANAVCASCHKAMDPLGFALENFDAVGAWRVEDGGGPIDASAELADGTKVDGVVGLRKAILSRPEVFVGTLAEKLLTYALGRGLDYRDMPAVRRIVSTAARDNYRFSALILGVARSTPFQMRTTAARAVESAEKR
jgi:mono/diheme cytochrome c family protein